MSPPLLALALGHTLAGWLFFVARYDDLAQGPLNLGHAAVALLATWGVLLLWLLPVAVAVRIRLPDRPLGDAPLTPGAMALRHLGLCAAMAAAVVAGTYVFQGVALLPGVFGGFWLLGLSCAGAALLIAHALRPAAGWLDPRHPWPTASQLAPTAAFGWSLFVLLELLFHHFGGAFVIVADMSAMLKVMTDEAIAMLFGPSAPWFATCLAIYGGACGALALWSVRRRSRPTCPTPPRVMAVAAAVGVVGIALLPVLSPRGRELVLHHVHPQVDDLAIALSSPAPPGADGEAAAQRLYPGFDLSPQPPAARVSLADYAASAQAAPRSSGRHDNVLVVFIDTLSRRHLQPWGYERPVAPNIARLAAESQRFDGARTNGGTTDLATVSLFYGLRPWFAANKTDTYRLGHGGLPFHLLAAAGGRKVGLFSGDWEVWQEGQSPVFPERCDAFVDARLAKAEEATRGHEVDRWAGLREDHLVDALLPWLDARAQAGDSWLAYLKLFRPHMPYDTPPDMPDGWRRPFAPQSEDYAVTDMDPTPERHPLLLNKYDNAIHFADHQLGRVLDHLRAGPPGAPDLWQRTAVVLVADHGEAWGEHGWFMHGHHNYEEFLEVPLLVRRPAGPPAVRAAPPHPPLAAAPPPDPRPVSLMDVAPTILDLLGLPPYPNHQGRSLLLAGPRPPFWGHSNSAARLTTLQVDHWKYTENLVTGEALLHDLAADPGEHKDLAWSPDPAHVERRAALSWLVHAGNAAQLEWAAGLRAHPTRSLLDLP